jgi:3-oxoacyl-[acyl-carrier-protein] synthase II
MRSPALTLARARPLTLWPLPHRQATDRYTHLAVAASRMAVEDAGLDLDKVEKRRFGVVVGSAFGGMDTFEKQVLQLDKGKKISPFAIPQLLGNTASGMIGIEPRRTHPNPHLHPHPNPTPTPTPTPTLALALTLSLTPHPGIELGAQGPNYGVASACAAGSHALGTAFRHLQVHAWAWAWAWA